MATYLKLELWQGTASKFAYTYSTVLSRTHANTHVRRLYACKSTHVSKHTCTCHCNSSTEDDIIRELDSILADEEEDDGQSFFSEVNPRNPKDVTKCTSGLPMDPRRLQLRVEVIQKMKVGCTAKGETVEGIAFHCQMICGSILLWFVEITY